MTSKYTPEDRYRAAAAFVTSGNSIAAAEQTGIPASTIRHWSKNDEEFIGMCQEIWCEYGAEVKAGLAQIIRESGEQVLDRIRQGDVIRDAKTGELVRVPMKGKGLAIVGAVAFDKLRIAENQPTQIVRREDSQQQLMRLKEQFAAIERAHRES